MPPRLGHADRHPPVLERAGRVVPLVLEQQVVDSPVQRSSAARWSSGVLPSGCETTSSADGKHDLAEAPDARGRRARPPAAPLGEALRSAAAAVRSAGGDGSPAGRRRRRSADADRARSSRCRRRGTPASSPGARSRNLIVLPPVSLDDPGAPPGPPAPPATSLRLPARARRPRPSPPPTRSADSRPRASANAVGPLPEIELPSAPAGERRGLGLGEARQQPGARRLGDAVVDRAAEQRVVAERERRHHRGHLRRLVQCDLERETSCGSTARASAVRICWSGRTSTTMQLVGDRELDEVERLHRSGSARSRRAARARCCRRADPRRPLPPRGRPRAAPSRSSGAPSSALTATAPATAEAALPPWPPESGRPFRTVSAMPRPPQRGGSALQHRARGQRRGVPVAPREGARMARVEHGDARRSSVHSARTVSPAPVDGQAEDVEPRADVAHAAGREGRRPRRPASCARQAQDVVQHAGGGHLRAGARAGDHQRIGLVARRGEHELVVRALDGGERTGRRAPAGARPRSWSASPSPRSAAPCPRPRRPRPAASSRRRAPPAGRGSPLERQRARPLGHQRLDRRAAQLARIAEQAGEDQRLAAHVHAREVVARIGLGVAALHRRAHRARRTTRRRTTSLST